MINCFYVTSQQKKTEALSNDIVAMMSYTLKVLSNGREGGSKVVSFDS